MTSPRINIHDCATGESTVREMTSIEHAAWLARMQQVIVPSEVQMRQARIALYQAGVLSQVQGAIEAIIDPNEKAIAQIEWEFSPTVKRSSPWISTIGGALGLTADQIDQLFVQAAKL